MTWSSKQIFPEIFKILMIVLLLTVAITPDGIAIQAAPVNGPPAADQTSLYNGDRENPEPDTWNPGKNLSSVKQQTWFQDLIIQWYLKPLCVLYPPSFPSIFFQPDRAPPLMNP